MRTEALRMERIIYQEQGMTLLDNFNFQVFSGEVMGLIPLDSRGMDEFIGLLQENKPIYYGFVYFKEKLVNSYQVRMHGENNVQIISNESNLVKYMSAAENVFALRRGYKGVIIKNKIFKQQLRMILQGLDVDIRTDISLKEMTPFERYVMEIIKAVISKPDLIVLKSPRSLLNFYDLEKLRKIVRYYAGKGITFVYISAYREELAAVCDRVSLMLQGRIVKVTEAEKFTEEFLSHYVNSKLPELRNNQGEEENSAENVFWCKNLFYKNIHGLSFSVKKGECLVIHDYGNQICRDIADAISYYGKPEKGEIGWKGKGQGLEHRRQVAVILENPAHSMVYEDMSYAENLCITLDHKFSNIWRQKKIRKGIVKEIVGEEYANMNLPVKNLSVRQKYYLVYTRILIQKPQVVFCVHPYLNIDVEMQEYIGTLLENFLENGIAVVIIAVNFQDVLYLADRLLLVKDGISHGSLTRNEFEHLVKVR